MIAGRGKRRASWVQQSREGALLWRHLGEAGQVRSEFTMRSNLVVHSFIFGWSVACYALMWDEGPVPKFEDGHMTSELFSGLVANGIICTLVTKIST